MASAAILNSPTLSSLSVSSSARTFTWASSTAIGTKTLFNSGAPAGFTIPAGVTLVDAYFVCYGVLSSGTTDTKIAIRKNGTIIAEQLVDDMPNMPFGFGAGMISVTTGDIIDVVHYTYGSGTVAFDPAYTFFSLCEIDREHIAAGSLASDTTIGTSDTTIPWIMDVDTALTYQGSGVFKVPTGITMALVSASVLPASFVLQNVEYHLYKNGTLIRKVANRNTYWLSGPVCFGLVPVATNDLLSVKCLVNTGTVVASVTRECRVNVEYLKAS